MDPSEREDSSTYKQQSADTTRLAEAPQRPVVVADRPKKSKTPLILSLLLVLALATAAAVGWLWYQQNGRVSDLEADLSKSRNNVARLESAAKAEDATDDSSDVTTDTDDSSSDAIVKASLAYAQADVNNSDLKLTSQIMYNKGDFANVSIGVEGGAGGTGLILKEVNDQWVVVFSGQDNPPQTVIDRYGIPKEALLTN